MSFTRTGVIPLNAEEVPPGLKFIGDVTIMNHLNIGDYGRMTEECHRVDGKTFNPGDLIARDSTGGLIKLESVTTTSADLLSTITSVGRPNNPAQRALEALFTNKLTSDIIMTNEDWKEKEEQFLADMNQLGYDHKIEYVAGQPFSRVLIQHPAQGKVALIINIIENSKSIDECEADEFTDALKDL